MSSFLDKFKKSTNNNGVDSLEEDRSFWIEILQKIAFPVLNNIKKDTLKKNMPFVSKDEQREKFIYFEAFSRVFNGMAPWLELGLDETPEGIIREKYITLTLNCIITIVNPGKTDCMSFTEPKQSLMDAALFAQGLLRSKTTIWDNLPIEIQARVIEELKNTRIIAPYENTWLLYTAIIEATLLEFTGECDIERLTYGVNKFKNEWYLGDGDYSYGPIYNTDLINSIMIHPMLIDILKVMKKFDIDKEEFLEIELKRATRYASKLERMISPEGTYPLASRAVTYRCGIFHTLALASLLEILPKDIKQAQVRAALTKVLKNHFSDNRNFDKKGWLTVGLNGNQLELAESNIDNGNVYGCALVFLPLGLSFNHEFWSAPAEDWTTVKAFKGLPVEMDKTIKF